MKKIFWKLKNIWKRRKLETGQITKIIIDRTRRKASAIENGCFILKGLKKISTEIGDVLEEFRTIFNKMRLIPTGTEGRNKAVNRQLEDIIKAN